MFYNLLYLIIAVYHIMEFTVLKDVSSNSDLEAVIFFNVFLGVMGIYLVKIEIIEL